MYDYINMFLYTKESQNVNPQKFFFNDKKTSNVKLTLWKHFGADDTSRNT